MVPSAVLRVPGTPNSDSPPRDSATRSSESGAGRESAGGSASGSASGPPGIRRRLQYLAPAVLLILVATWEAWAALSAGGDVPDATAWRDAAAAVRERHAPGDLIVFAPDWIDPVGRMHLGDLIPVAMAGRMDDARYGTVWELAIRGARAPESRDREVAWSGEFAGVTVRRLVAEPAVVLTDFLAAFSRATVAPGGAAGADSRAITWVGRPAVRLEEVGFTPRRCIRVEPRPDQTVRVVYRGVPLGRSLVGHVGLADVFTRRDIRDPGRLTVSVAGRELARVEFGVEDGWVRFSADTEPAESAEVEFAATAVGPGARKRWICFAAEARK